MSRRPPPENTFVSWATDRPEESTTPVAKQAKRRRQWWHLDSVIIAVLLLVADAVAVFVLAVIIIGPKRLFVGLSCTRYWQQRADIALQSFWAVVILVVVTTAVAALLWRRHLLAVAVTQLLVGVVVLPSTLIAHAHALDVIHHPLVNGVSAAASSDTGGACDQFD